MARAGWHAVPGTAWARLEMPLFLLPETREACLDTSAAPELFSEVVSSASAVSAGDFCFPIVSPLLLIRCLDPPEPSNRHATAASLLTPPSGPLRPILEAHHPLTFAAHRRCSSSSLASTHTLLALPTQQPPSRRCAGQSQAQGGIAILLERRPCLPSSPNGSRSSNILPSSYTLSRPPSRRNNRHGRGTTHLDIVGDKRAAHFPASPAFYSILLLIPSLKLESWAACSLRGELRPGHGTTSHATSRPESRLARRRPRLDQRHDPGLHPAIPDTLRCAVGPHTTCLRRDNPRPRCSSSLFAFDLSLERLQDPVRILRALHR